VLAVHGILATSSAWLAVADALADDVALIAPDLRGRGDSHSLPGPFGLDAHVADLLAVLDALELDRVVALGHSMGAYVVARLAVRHPHRVARLVLVDGGLTIPGSERIDPGPFMRSFLGPALARLRMTFADVDAYVAWWSKHPAIANSDIDPAVLRGYAEHDLAGTPPQLRSSINADALEPDGSDVLRSVDARALTRPAVLLCAPRGMLNDRKAMQPLPLVREWAAQDRGRRRALQVADTNHYSIALGVAGAAAVAAEVRAAVAAAAGG
jgi:pimeloyl-ACP methyl ester carboxylesterase